MRTVLITPATFKPFSIEELKNRPELRISSTDDDANLVSMLDSAIEEYQEFSNRILCQSTWDLYLDEFPDDDDDCCIETPGPLIAAGLSIGYTDTAGAAQTMTASDYVVDVTNPLVGRISLAYGKSWPSTYDQINVVIVRFVAGYTSAAAIPQNIKNGLLLRLQELYDGIDRSAGYRACWAAYQRIAV